MQMIVTSSLIAVMPSVFSNERKNSATDLLQFFFNFKIWTSLTSKIARMLLSLCMCRIFVPSNGFVCLSLGAAVLSSAAS